MNWARLDSEFRGFAWKRLTAHEIDPRVSNGHEFQGVNGLADLLGRVDRADIPTDYYLLADNDDGEISVREVIRSTAKWYDSRKNHPERSAEWRLYYPADAGRIQSRCEDGDLMVAGLRKDGTLAVMLAPQGSSTETALRNVLGLGRVPQRGRGNTRWIEASPEDVGLAGAETLEQMQLSFAATAPAGARPPLPPPSIDFSKDQIAMRLAGCMLERWPQSLGPSDDVANEIRRHAGLGAGEMLSDPDFVLNRWLELGEAAYRIWEKEVFGSFLGPIRWDREVGDLDLAERVSQKWMAFRQSRVSRAGRVLELFLVPIFESWKLRYDWGAVLPGNKRPDFLFPGAKEYGEMSFPADRLRLLGAKTSIKERWRQILAEGGRVTRKHGITRDAAITSSAFEQMAAENFTVVMPRPVLDRYEVVAPNQVTLEDFLREVRSIQDG
jgi:hypothetical protein